MFLSSRQQQILKAIVEDHIATAEPVGSRSLSKRFGFGLSAATLRNEMADLEEEGYLRQPHTSAGRVPSQRGYRAFVDGLMERPLPLEPAAQEVLGQLQVKAQDLHAILQQAAKLTAVLAQATAIVRAPRLRRARLQHLQLVPVGEAGAMMVVVTDQGSTHSQFVPLPGPLDLDEVALLTQFLNHRLKGSLVGRLAEAALQGELEALVGGGQELLQAFGAQLGVGAAAEERVFVGHPSYLAAQPEFSERAKIQNLLGILEREDALAGLLGELHPQEVTGQVQVGIGSELPLVDLHECAVVSAPYAIGGNPVGEVAVLGPTRFAYPRAMVVVEAMALHLSATLDRVFGVPASRAKVGKA